MLPIDEAAPDGSRAKWLKGNADKRLLDSLKYLNERATATMGRSFPGAGDCIENARARNLPLGAGAYAIHSRLLRVMRRGDASEAVRVLEQLRTGHLDMGMLRIWPYGSGARPAFVEDSLQKVMEEEHVREYGVAYDAGPPHVDDVTGLIAKVHMVLDELAELDRETYREIEEYVSDVVVIRSREINAGTSFCAHGLILLRELGPDRAWTTYLENLVHEAAHLHLFLVWTVDPILECGANDRYKSPLRPGERPLSAIFHAMFVLARTIRAMRIFKDIDRHRRDIEAMSTSYNYLQNPSSFEEKFRETYTTIRKHAKLTVVGNTLLESCRAMVGGK